MPTEYDKLVRDGIPALIRENGEHPVTRRAEGVERERYLAAKLVEEATEVCEAFEDDDESVAAELADLQAALDALLLRRDRERVARIRTEKADERGEFDEGVVLERVTGGGDAE